MGSTMISGGKGKDGRREMTVGELVAMFYDEAQRVTRSQAEADRLAKLSLLDALKMGRVKTTRQG